MESRTCKSHARERMMVRESRRRDLNPRPTVYKIGDRRAAALAGGGSGEVCWGFKRDLRAVSRVSVWSGYVQFVGKTLATIRPWAVNRSRPAGAKTRVP